MKNIKMPPDWDKKLKKHWIAVMSENRKRYLKFKYDIEGIYI